MRRKINEWNGRELGRISVSLGIVFSTILAVACSKAEVEEPPTPQEERVELRVGSAAPNETRGAPYPPAEPSDRVPNVDEGEWPPVPDGPRVGEMEPTNPPVEIRELEVKPDDKSEDETENGGPP